MMKLKIKGTFDAAHRLVNYKGKCHELHGHTYHYEIIITGKVDPETGMIVDFGELKNDIEVFDHSYINDFKDLRDNPTAENIVQWLVYRIEKIYNVKVVRFELWETPNNSVVYENEDL